MEIIIIAAMALNRVIGYNNQIPWHIPEDLAHFKKTTLGHPVIIGRKTFTSIGTTLSGRENIIISSNKNLSIPGASVVHSIEQAFEKCKNKPKVFILGGAEIYKQTLPIADTLILTILEQEVEGDTFFPEYDENSFTKVKEYPLQSEIPCTVKIYTSLRT